jgi:hypothetical protein
MKNLFLAFKGMPINPEIRFFVKDGEVLCWHWYWIEEAIEKGTYKIKLPKNWKEIIEKEKEDLIKTNEIALLEGDAIIMASHFQGYWSIDFCKSKKGLWYLIDMAKGLASWHPEDCPIKELMEKKENN